MAIKPTNNDAFFREVDEELRKEQLSGWWKRYGIIAIVAVILLVAAIGGYLWWQHKQQVEAGERGERLEQVFDDIEAGRTEGIDARLDALAAEDSPAHRAAALLVKADMAMQAGNDAAAVAGFKTVAEDANLPEPYRNLALIRQTALEFDTIPPAQVIERLQPLAQPGNPWFGTAGEMVAVAWLKQGQPQRAAPIFAAIAKQENIPETIRSRAVQMAGALGVDAVEDVPAPGASAGETKEANQ